MDVDFMKGKLASTENFAIEIWNQIVDDISAYQGAELQAVKLYETARNFVEYFGGK